MSDKKVPQEAGKAVDEDLAETISGGLTTCTPQQLIDITGQLRQAYDNLVDFTSHVIERVDTSIK